MLQNNFRVMLLWVWRFWWCFFVFARGAYHSFHDGLKPAYENCCTCAGAAKKLAGVLNNKLFRPSFPELVRNWLNAPIGGGAGDGSAATNGGA